MAAMTPQPTWTPSRSVVLVGLMGAGKTSIGRRLAGRFGLPFVDVDHEIEAAAGCAIETIFELHGEEAFRDCERRVIKRLLDRPVQVLATGGGTFIDPETRRWVKDKAVSLWLRAELELLIDRGSRRGNRPLLKRGEPREILAQLIADRYPIYAEADVIVDSLDAPTEATVEASLRALHRFFAQERQRVSS